MWQDDVSMPMGSARSPQSLQEHGLLRRVYPTRRSAMLTMLGRIAQKLNGPVLTLTLGVISQPARPAAL